MKRLIKISICTSFAALCMAACTSNNVVINGVIAQAPDTEIIVKQLDINVYNVLDTIKTDAQGHLQYKMSIDKAQAEFIYLFKADTRVAGLLLEAGDNVSFEADTLGNYSVTGSENSRKLSEVNRAYTKFMNDLYQSRDNSAQMAKIYLDHYRSSVKYVMENSHSLTIIPVLYETMSEVSPVFNQSTDALIFKSAADSLSTIYPESRYVKALINEAQRRMRILEFEGQLRSAPTTSYPDLVLPNINGENVALSSVESKVVLLHFWSADQVSQKMMNIEVLKPLWDKYHDKGFEIYSVCIGVDKALWGSVVSAQKLPWINVCDGLGASSKAVLTYNITSVPQSLLIIDGEISTKSLSNVDEVSKEIALALR